MNRPNTSSPTTAGERHAQPELGRAAREDRPRAADDQARLVDQPLRLPERRHHRPRRLSTRSGIGVAEHQDVEVRHATQRTGRSGLGCRSETHDYDGGMPRIVLVQGDITRQDVDADRERGQHRRCGPGGGVDGAITRAAGPDALADRERVIRERGDPSAPHGRGGRDDRRRARGAVDHPHRRSRLLRVAGRRSAARELPHADACEVADELGARTVAFPAISTGVYGYPLDEAAPVAIEAVRSADTAVEEVRFVLFDGDRVAAFDAALR